ncbi:hypothetical protein AVEN_72572-1 [Araneus ventricosus]|uniref:Rab-GAP TBC domain-containing protein n=1 Tax=Araneus ventricosus TaxID=182803 RepID=A0A4Y2V1H2_ARAVE|nr:hypothetical protein AVEN_72572-1 [Araneus ventricosus]
MYPIRRGWASHQIIKRYVRKGIPSSHRGTVWSLISGAKELKDQQPDLYTAILKRPLKQEIIETIDLGNALFIV